MEQMIEAVLIGMLDLHGRLDLQAVPWRPEEEQMLDLPAILQAHLGDAANAKVLAQVLPSIQGYGRAAMRLFRILAAPLFNLRKYQEVRQIGRGAFGTVSQTSLPDTLAWCKLNALEMASAFGRTLPMWKKKDKIQLTIHFAMML